MSVQFTVFREDNNGKTRGGWGGGGGLLQEQKQVKKKKKSNEGRIKNCVMLKMTFTSTRHDRNCQERFSETMLS